MTAMYIIKVKGARGEPRLRLELLDRFVTRIFNLHFIYILFLLFLIYDYMLMINKKTKRYKSWHTTKSRR